MPITYRLIIYILGQMTLFAFAINYFEFVWRCHTLCETVRSAKQNRNTLCRSQHSPGNEVAIAKSTLGTAKNGPSETRWSWQPPAATSAQIAQARCKRWHPRELHPHMWGGQAARRLPKTVRCTISASMPSCLCWYQLLSSLFYSPPTSLKSLNVW